MKGGRPAYSPPLRTISAMMAAATSFSLVPSRDASIPARIACSQIRAPARMYVNSSGVLMTRNSSTVPEASTSCPPACLIPS